MTSKAQALKEQAIMYVRLYLKEVGGLHLVLEAGVEEGGDYISVYDVEGNQVMEG